MDDAGPQPGDGPADGPVPGRDDQQGDQGDHQGDHQGDRSDGPRVGPVDDFQRRHSALGLPIAVLYKYFDDQATYLAVIATYYALFAIFPLLLLATSVLGFVLEGNTDLQQQVLESTLSQFPIIGDQFRQPEGLTGSTPAVVLGALVALYGAIGLGTAVQNALNVAWSVPRNSRPNPFLLRIKSLVIVSLSGLAILGLTTLSILASDTQVMGVMDDWPARWPVRLLSILAVALVLTLLLRLGSARSDRTRTTLPGALLIAILWHGLQTLGAAYVTNVLANASSLNQTFGLVLGLMALLFLASVMGMLGVELNIVIERHLWPRALLTPFTDAVVLTDADRRAYAGYARAQRHKGFQHVLVDFGDGQPVRPGDRDERESG